MNGEILLYQTEDGKTKIEVILENETMWLNQYQLADLFQTDRTSIVRHIRNIYSTNELSEEATCVKNTQVQNEGKRTVKREILYYNLDVIIAVGYRVNSHRGTQFRIWASQRLKEYLIKGFVLDDERLKSGKQMNYFDELLDRIRDIRSSERVFYQKVKDIYATSIDYDPNTKFTQDFFATVQNKLHWAIHQHTAAELIKSRANANKPNMGLTVWKGDKIRKSDITIAKNYLNEHELKELNLLVEQYLAFAEAQAFAKRPMYMSDWVKKLNDILVINDREVLNHTGRITKQLAEEIATKEYEKYNEQQKNKEAEASLKELERDIKLLTQNNKKPPQK
jgi:hypothetical protein